MKPVLSGHLKRTPKLVLKTDYRLMQVKSIAECHSTIISTLIRLPFVLKTCVLSIFEWPLKTGFTVNAMFCSTALVWRLSSAKTSRNGSIYHWRNGGLIFFPLGTCV